MTPAITISPANVAVDAGKAKAHRHPKHSERPLPVIVTVLPSCYFCTRDAIFDFRMLNGQWAYGCPQHWLEHRASPIVGLGHASRLQLEPRLPKSSDPTAMQEELLMKSKPVPPRDDSGTHVHDAEVHDLVIEDLDRDVVKDQPPCSRGDVFCDD